ncbi:MAG TPA: hypothetical protein VG755_41560 [Nannocystaceae bacterium]|nr:hypothetical protein [Nannocystaceae bacterium]
MSDELDARIRQLPRSIDPPADLWPDIAARIESRSRTRIAFFGVLAAAAIVLVFVGTRSEATARSLQRGWSALAIAPPVPQPTAPVELFPGEDQLRSAAGELARAYEQRRPLLDRELLAVYESNLGIVDDAIDRSRAALVDRPEDPQLQRALDRAYRHKLALLRRASGGAP